MQLVGLAKTRSTDEDDPKYQVFDRGPDEATYRQLHSKVPPEKVCTAIEKVFTGHHGLQCFVRLSCVFVP